MDELPGADQRRDDARAPLLSWPVLYAIVLGVLAVQVVLYAALSRVLG